MQIPEDRKKALLRNWGPMAESLDCVAEIKVIDQREHWACYVFAMNPENEDEIACLFHDKLGGIEIWDWSWHELCQLYDGEGEYPMLDPEYRRIRVTALLKRLKNDT